MRVKPGRQPDRRMAAFRLSTRTAGIIFAYTDPTVSIANSAATTDDPAVDIRFEYEPSGNEQHFKAHLAPGHPLSGNGLLRLRNNGDACTVTIADNAYKGQPVTRPLAAGRSRLR